MLTPWEATVLQERDRMGEIANARRKLPCHAGGRTCPSERKKLGKRSVREGKEQRQ